MLLVHIMLQTGHAYINAERIKTLYKCNLIFGLIYERRLKIGYSFIKPEIPFAAVLLICLEKFNLESKITPKYFTLSNQFNLILSI